MIGEDDATVSEQVSAKYLQCPYQSEGLQLRYGVIALGNCQRTGRKGYRVDLTICLLLGKHSSESSGASICLNNEGVLRMELWICEHRTTNQQLLQALECFLSRVSPLKSGVLLE